MNIFLIVTIGLILLFLPLFAASCIRFIRKLIPLEIESKKVTDWLNFYGAYFGSLLALIAALIIFNYQRVDSIRPYILVSRSEIKENYPEYSTYFLVNEKITVNPDTRKINDPNRDERFFVVRIKNIGQGAALDISLYDSSGRKAAVFNRRMKILSANDLTSLEVGGTFEFLFDFDLNKKYEVNKNNPNVINEIIRFSYNDIFGNSYHQNAMFEFDRSSGTGGLENAN